MSHFQRKLGGLGQIYCRVEASDQRDWVWNPRYHLQRFDVMDQAAMEKIRIEITYCDGDMPRYRRPIPMP